MRRIILACAFAGIFAMPAKADETLKFRVVQYVASIQTQPVGDVNNHLQGFVRYPGIASFPDGSTARTFVFNMFDGQALVAGEQPTAMKTSFLAMARSCGGNSTEHTRSTAKVYFQVAAPLL